MLKNKLIIYNPEAPPIRDCEIEEKILSYDGIETSNELLLLKARVLKKQNRIGKLLIIKNGKMSKVTNEGIYENMEVWDCELVDECLDIILGF